MNDKERKKKSIKLIKNKLLENKIRRCQTADELKEVLEYIIKKYGSQKIFSINAIARDLKSVYEKFTQDAREGALPAERIYRILHKDEENLGKCVVCGGWCKFIRFNKGYRKTDSHYCANFRYNFMEKNEDSKAVRMRIGTCKICGKKYRYLHNHVPIHGMTYGEYCYKYGDRENKDLIKCEVCGELHLRTIVQHIKLKHGMTIKQYQRKYKGCPVVSKGYSSISYVEKLSKMMREGKTFTFDRNSLYYIEINHNMLKVLEDYLENSHYLTAKIPLMVDDTDIDDTEVIRTKPVKLKIVGRNSNEEDQENEEENEMNN